jgi:hypothetical protein
MINNFLMHHASMVFIRLDQSNAEKTATFPKRFDGNFIMLLFQLLTREEALIRRIAWFLLKGRARKI